MNEDNTALLNARAMLGCVIRASTIGPYLMLTVSTWYMHVESVNNARRDRQRPEAAFNMSIEPGLQESPSFRWMVVGDLMISRTLPGEIPEPVFNAFLSAIKDKKIPLIFAFTIGTATLKPTMRKAAAETLKEVGTAAVVLTDNRFTRGILTAVSWLGAKIKTYSWNDLEKAISDAQLDARAQAEVRRLAPIFRVELAKYNEDIDT